LVNDVVADVSPTSGALATLVGKISDDVVRAEVLDEVV
jgi:hypothetical protein